MPNMPRTLPAPTWHGFPEGIAETQRKYIDFVERHARSQSQDRPAELRARIAQLEQRSTSLRQNIKSYNEEARAKSELLEQLQAQGDVADTVLEQFYVQLIAMPEVIGTRLGDAGELVIMIRPLRVDEVDLGDFEITWQTFVNGDSQLVMVRDPKQDYRVTGNFYRSRFNARRVGSWSQEIYVNDYYALHDRNFKLLKSYNLPAIVRSLCDNLIGDRHLNNNAKRLSTETKALWEGYEGNFVTPFRRFVEASGVEPVQSRIADLESLVASYREYAAESVQTVKDVRQELRIAKAELEKLEAAPKRDTLTDPAESVAELRYLTTGIPGVMGMRFEDDGTPVVHFRRSFEYRGRRYDFGDFELFFRTKTTDTVIELHETRLPKGGRLGSPYWHPAYPRELRPHRSDWFCFGRRAQMLSDLFATGQFGHFLSVLVNTLNSVNEGSELDYATPELEIPFSELWHHTPRTRPRRRKRDAVLFLVDALK